MAVSAQDRILAAWNEECCLVKVCLRGGAKQTGRLAGWDRFSIMLDIRGGVIECIQKKAILSIAPSSLVELPSGDRPGLAACRGLRR